MYIRMGMFSQTVLKCMFVWIEKVMKMLSELQTSQKTVGLKQSIKKIKSGEAKKVFIATDAAPSLVEEIKAAIKGTETKIVEVSGMKELGRAAGIDVGAAVVVVY